MAGTLKIPATYVCAVRFALTTYPVREGHDTTSPHADTFKHTLNPELVQLRVTPSALWFSRLRTLPPKVSVGAES